MAKQHSPGFLKIAHEAKARVTECTVEDVVKRQQAGEAVVVVDVREESEFAAGHAPGALHIGKGVLERDIEVKIPDPATPVVLYCGGGFRSALAAETMQKMGYTNVISMDGGFTAWAAKGHPVEKA